MTASRRFRQFADRGRKRNVCLIVMARSHYKLGSLNPGAFELTFLRGVPIEDKHTMLAH